MSFEDWVRLAGAVMAMWCAGMESARVIYYSSDYKTYRDGLRFRMMLKSIGYLLLLGAVAFGNIDRMIHGIPFSSASYAVLAALVLVACALPGIAHVERRILNNWDRRKI